MKKVFISTPMSGRTVEAINNSIDAMHKIAEVMVGESLQPIYAFNHSQARGGDNLYYLSDSFKLMADCDYVIRINDDWRFADCHIIRTAAEAYGVPTLVVDVSHFKAFEDLILRYDEDILGDADEE